MNEVQLILVLTVTAMNFPVGLIKCSESEWCTPLQKMICELVTRYLPLVASRGDASGGEAVTFASTAVSQTLAVLHHAALSLLRVEGDLLHREVLVLLLRLALRVSTEYVSRLAKTRGRREARLGEDGGCGSRTCSFSSWTFSLIWAECLA